MNILPMGGLGVWRKIHVKRKKRNIIMSGAAGAAGVSSSVGGAAGTHAPTPSDGAAAATTDAPKISGPAGDAENAEKFGQGANINMTQNFNWITVLEFSFAPSTPLPATWRSTPCFSHSEHDLNL